MLSTYSTPSSHTLSRRSPELSTDDCGPSANDTCDRGACGHGPRSGMDWRPTPVIAATRSATPSSVMSVISYRVVEYALRNVGMSATDRPGRTTGRIRPVSARRSLVNASRSIDASNWAPLPSVGGAAPSARRL
ncbi:hypothetical protein GCM10029964_057410 [Kibdelosporangium lantanae]